MSLFLGVEGVVGVTFGGCRIVGVILGGCGFVDVICGCEWVCSCA